jgi:MFS transporter, NNP family, nitrate/nitrite transporter
MTSAFFKAGRSPSLIACFLNFDLSFAGWSSLAPCTAPERGLNAGQTGLMVATPIRAGAFLRIVSGVFVDPMEGKSLRYLHAASPIVRC